MINNIQKKMKDMNNTFIDLKRRIIFVIFAIIIFRIGSFIPIPGINHVILLNFLKEKKNHIIDLFNIFSGGSLSHASIFSLGMMPFISASVIMQLLIYINKYFSNLKKEGELGKKKIDQYIRYITVLISIFQSCIISLTLPYINGLEKLIINLNFYFYFTTIISLCTGTVLLMWLGELITIRGIGNGISIIICVGIISKLFPCIVGIVNSILSGNFVLLKFLIISLILLVVLFLIVFVERSHRRIILHYAQNRNFRNINTVQHTYLPLKINLSGVIPAIFSSGIITFLSTILLWIGTYTRYHLLVGIIYYLKSIYVVYVIIYSILVYLFCAFYSDISFNPKEISNNLKKSNMFIIGIRPGFHTAKYISNIIRKIVFLNSLYIITISLIPELIKIIFHVSLYCGGTSILIVVVVVIDIINQIQTMIISNKYNSILRKSPIGLNS